MIDAYIEINRDEAVDEYGREPLLTSRHGRPAASNLRAHVNALTRPCHYARECPHDREESQCEATEYKYANRCPSSVPPHAIRRSAITAWLNDGHGKELLADRMNVSAKTLDKHYDVRTKAEKRELRRKEFMMGDH